MEQRQFQNKSGDSDGSMRIDNDTVFNLLMKLNETVSGTATNINALSKKLDNVQKQMDDQFNRFQDEIDEVSDIANKANNKVNQMQKQSTSKLSLLELIWIPVIASIIPTILPHIHIH